MGLSQLINSNSTISSSIVPLFYRCMVSFDLMCYDYINLLMTHPCDHNELSGSQGHLLYLHYQLRPHWLVMSALHAYQLIVTAIHQLQDYCQ